MNCYNCFTLRAVRTGGALAQAGVRLKDRADKVPRLLLADVVTCRERLEIWLY